MSNNNVPLVSVICTAYNHEKYIAQALEGFVLQKTSFPMEVIVHDDASSDNTAQIIAEYEKKYRDLFVTVYQRENQYSKKNVSIWFDIAFPLARGRYIAFCEGDDYWTDPYKIQKQIDFMENHPDFAICFHNMQVIYEGETHLNRLSNNHQKEITTIETLASGNYIYTASCVFRNNYLKKPDWFCQCPVRDYPLHLLNARHGKIKFIDEVMGVYRVHKGGLWENKILSYRLEQWANMLKLIGDQFDRRINKILNHSLRSMNFDLMRLYLNAGDYEKSKHYFMQFKENYPWWFCHLKIWRLLMKYFQRRLFKPLQAPSQTK